MSIDFIHIHNLNISRWQELRFFKLWDLLDSTDRLKDGAAKAILQAHSPPANPNAHLNFDVNWQNAAYFNWTCLHEASASHRSAMVIHLLIYGYGADVIA